MLKAKPIAVHLKERKDTNLLIEDFMLLANEAVAKHLSKLTSNGVTTSPPFTACTMSQTLTASRTSQISSA